jgi:signal transduction histidine kinase
MAIVGLIAALVVVLSALLFVQFRQTMDETRESNSAAMADALLKQAERRAQGVAGFLSESLTDSLAQQQWDAVRYLALSTRGRRGVDYVRVFNASRGIVVDDTDTVVADSPGAPDTKMTAVLTFGRSVTTITGDRLSVSVPVMAGERILGGVTVGLSLADEQSDIAATQALLKGIHQKGTARLLAVSGIAAFVFAAIGILFSVAVARGISGPIEKLVTLTRQIGRGAVDVAPPEQRSDEIGELGLALVTMARQRREAEEKARRLQAELAHVSRITTMGEMATGLAHELNQPLTAISNYLRGSITRLRKSNTVTKDVLDAMERAAAEAIRAGEVIRRVRSFVRKVEPEKLPVDINATIRETIDLLRAEAQCHDVAIILDLAPGLAPVAADKIQVQQVILNLARNGIEAARDNAPSPRQVSISTVPQGEDLVRVTVYDSGSGVPDTLRESIFEPFVTTKGDGLGMGLAICRTIVEAHGSRLELNEEVGAGTTFQFSLPVAEPADATNTPPTAAC